MPTPPRNKPLISDLPVTINKFSIYQVTKTPGSFFYKASGK